MISASVGVNSSLLLEPAQTLTFALDPAASSARACLTLTNISPRKHVVFKVRTTNVDMFMVKPAQGVIEPSGEVPVVITLLTEAGARLLRMAPVERAALIERFLIQSIDRAEDMLGFSVDDLAAFWRRLPKELITNKKLTCRFVEARDGEPDVHLPMQRMRLHVDEPARAPTPVFASQPPQQPRSPVKAETPQTSPPQTTSRDPQVQVRLSNKHDAKKLKTKPQAQAQAQAPPPPPIAALGARVGARPGRTPPTAMKMPSSPVPSLRPKPVIVHHSSSSSNSSHSSNQSGHDEQRDDLGTGISNISSNDSYATNRVAQMQFDERIQSDDTLEYRLHPSESLLFPVHHAYPNDSPTGIVEGKSYFFITNKARYSGLAFKIKTSNHTGYFVKPARGFIDAKSAQRVDVFVNAPDAARFDAQSREMKDRFLVELLFVGPAKSSEMLALSDDQRRQELQLIWDQSKSADRRQSVLACQILEEDSPIDPSHQTAEQARALLQKNQVATTLSFNNNSPVPRETAGESANPWIHARPVSTATSPAGSMHTPRGQQPPQYQQVRSPVMQQSRSPVKQAPRSPGIATAQMRSPVRQPHPQQHQQYYSGPPRPQRAAFDDDGTFYP